MSSSHYTSSNLGGIKRGDGEETGDLEAQPSETTERAGSGAGAVVTGDSSALGESRGMAPLQTGDAELDDLTVVDASDPDLGLTGIGDVEPEDWAADSGPTHTGEEAAPAENGRLREPRRVAFSGLSCKTTIAVSEPP